LQPGLEKQAIETYSYLKGAVALLIAIGDGKAKDENP
jgi:hypothetical protein